MNLGDFRRLTKDLPDSFLMCYHGYDKGCCHITYPSDWNYIGPEGWCYIDNKHKTILLNPGEDYDKRKISN